MAYIGLISDTHGYFDEKVRKFLEPVDVRQGPVFDRAVAFRVSAQVVEIDGQAGLQEIPAES